MNAYDRGRRDAGLFCEVRRDAGGGWSGVLESTGAIVWILEPVTAEYLRGLAAGGCRVQSLELRPGAARRNQAFFAKTLPAA